MPDNIEAPSPLRNTVPSHLNLRELAIKRLNEETRSRTPGVGSPDRLYVNQLRARSVTPTRWRSPRSDDFKADEVLNERLKHYGLNFPENNEEYRKKLYDENSKWFSRTKKTDFEPSDHLCYNIETHQEQAKYLCHVLVNLYIAISSLDIEGSIAISNKDLVELQNEIDDLALKTDLFRISNDNRVDESNLSGSESYDEDELYNENDYINSMGPDLHATGKITAKSASIINVNHWTNELKNCMNFDIPLSLRKSLATVYYYLALVKGQKVSRELHIEMFDILVDNDDQGTDFTTLLKNQGLVLDHSILFEFFLSFLPYPDADYTRFDLSTKEDSKLFRLLLKLAHYSQPFFNASDETILTSSMDKLLVSFSPSTLSIVLPILSSYVPYHYHETKNITDYFPFCFSLWTSVSASVVVDTHLFEFVGCVVEDLYLKALKDDSMFLSKYNIQLGPFGIFTEDQMTFLFNRLQGHLRTNTQIHSYSKTMRAFIYSIMGNDNELFFKKLIDLIRSIETYVYPSNSGFWTKPIAKFVHTFIKMYHGRVQREVKYKSSKNYGQMSLNSECNSKVIKLFLNVLRTGAQNKSLDIANYYISCFAYLLDLGSNNRHLILDKVLEDIYDALSDEFVDSRHRVISALKQFTRVVRFMVVDKLYRVHVTNILTMLIAKIDPNDILLTTNIINVIISISSFTPFKNLIGDNEYLTFESDTIPFVQQHYFYIKDHSLKRFKYDEQLLNNAFRASTTEFKNILRLYVDKIFQLVDIELDEGFMIKLNQASMIMIEAMDDDVFSYFAEVFQKIFWDNDMFKEKDPNYEIIVTPLAAISKRNSELRPKLLDLLMLNIKEQIERGAGSVRSVSEIQQRDVKLVLYLTALNEVLRYCYGTIIKYDEKLLDFIKYLFENVVNPALNVISSILIHNILASLTTTEIITQEMFQQDCAIPDEERWGGLQFDKIKFDVNNLKFNWHNPNDDEIKLAFKMFESITEYAIDGAEKLIADPRSTTRFGDDIQKFILILTHAVSGASLLFDADFNKNIHSSKRGDSSSYREKLLLLKYMRERKCDNQELNIDMEQISSSKNEDEFISPYIKEGDENNSDIVVINEDMSNELFTNEGEYSEVPSGVGTPTPGNICINSSMNSGLVFRDLDIYRCNYYFGTTVEEKFENSLYFEVHKIRSKIGLFFHKLFNFFSDNFENNTKIFQILLHGFRVWFTDVGQETLFSNDSRAVLDLDFVENIQSLSHLDQPFTRTCLALKVNTYHQNRVLLHSTNRYPSKLEIQILRDIITLATSVYPDIHRIAHGTVVHSMKQLIGSYSLIIRQLLTSLKDAIQNQLYKQIEVILKVIRIKKIQNKLVKDYKNIEELIYLLIECCKINEQDISVYADNILTDILLGVSIPPSICVYDERMFSTITPPDFTIKLQVDAVKKAKKNKREQYVNLIVELQDKLIRTLENEEFSWRTQVFLIRFITKFQSNFEIETNNEAIHAIFSQTYSNHPKLVHLVIKSLLSVSNKILSLSDYNYDISKSVDFSFDPSTVFELDSSKIDFPEVFRREMNNFDNPQFFIDSRAYVGWLCWGGPVKLIKPAMFEITLKDPEINAFKSLGKLITKKHLTNIISTLIKDNETKVVFSSGEVSFFVLISILISKGLTELSFEDLFDLCKTNYKRTEKSSMIISIEIVGALIYCSKYVTEKEIQNQQQFLDEFLYNCLNQDLNQDAFDIWSTLCWWLPSVVDIRRCPSFIKNFADVKSLLNINSDRANEQASRLSMLRNILASLEFKSFDIEPILESLIFDHPYDQVREVIARLFTTLIQNDSYPSVDTSEHLLELESATDGLGIPLKTISGRMDKIVKDNFKIILLEYMKTRSLTPQEILKTKYYYMSSTMFYWIREMAKGPNRILLIPYVSSYIIPFLGTLINQKDVCKLGGIDPSKIFLSLATMPIRRTFIKPLIDTLCEANTVINSSFQIRIELVFIEYLLSSLLLQLTEQDLVTVFDFVTYQLHNPSFIEVRIRAAAVLSDLVHNMGETPRVRNLIENFDKYINNYTFKEKQKLSKTDVNIHASVLGLGGIINAFPYVFPLPTWIPKQLAILSSWARTSGMSGTAAKETISEFKKVRTDTWKFDRMIFTADELEDLEGVLWRSYYA